MTTTAQRPWQHRVSAVVDRLHELLDEVSEASLWSMGPGETADTLIALTRLRARQGELELRIAAHAETVQVGEATGAVSTSAWWAHQTRLDRRAAATSMHLAQALSTTYRQVQAAMATGEVSQDQAAVIVRALETLPADLDPTILSEAEARLVADAAVHDPAALRHLGRRVLDVIAPEVGEAHESRILEREEAAATAAARFTMSDDGHGKTHGRFTIPTLHAAMLRKALLALAAPKHRAAVEGAGAPRRPGPERMGRAFLEYIAGYPAKKLPKTGGLNATIVVTMTLEALIGGLKAAHLDTGEKISAALARKLACQAAIIPIVLGGDSEVLDLGRDTRFHPTAHRVAIGARDRTCTAEGCDWPPGLCHVHHNKPWSEGGDTSVADGRLLCPRHHARAHDPTYTTTHLPSGKVAFTRRT